MALTYCEGCQEIEGDTEEIDGVNYCADCGEPVTGIPEHDEIDMER